MTLEELPPILVVQEAADALRVHPQTIYMMIERKTLRAARVGKGQRSIRIEKAEIMRVMREGIPPSPPTPKPTRMAGLGLVGS